MSLFFGAAALTLIIFVISNVAKNVNEQKKESQWDDEVTPAHLKPSDSFFTKDRGGFFWVMCFLFLLFALNVVMPGQQEEVETEKKQEPKIPEGFSPWNGRHLAFSRRVKGMLNDPKSFEHVSTRYLKTDHEIRIWMTFRAKNPYNATVTQTWSGWYSSDGEFIKLIK